MKRCRLIASLFLALTLCGCTDGAGRSISGSYPRLEYRNSAYNLDPYNREIAVEDGFYLDEGHTYDVVETDSGYDLVLHFVECEEVTE